MLGYLAGVVVLAHALGLATRIGRALPGRLAGTVWFYVAAAAALPAGMGLGLWLAGGGWPGRRTPTWQCAWPTCT